MNRRALLLVIIGLVAAVAASVVVYYLVTNVPQQTPQPVVQGPTPVPQKQVIIAATDIAANVVITRSQVTTASYPIDLVPEDAITSIGDVINTTAKTPVFSGQVLLKRQFLAAQGRTGASVDIPPGKVLVAFPSTDMLNATGAVQPGDHVDIMLSIPVSGTTQLDSGSTNGTQVQPGKLALVTQATLQNIEVYTIGEWTPPGQEATNTNASANSNSSLKIITFIVDHQEALILKYVKDSGGTIDLAVRSAADNQEVQTDPVTLDYLVDLFGFVGLVPPKPTP